jgi:hypothetical protein
MMPSPSIDHRSDTRHSCGLSAGSAHARVDPLDWSAVAPPISSRHVRSARSSLHAHTCLAVKRAERLLQSNPLAPGAAAKSP